MKNERQIPHNTQSIYSTQNRILIGVRCPCCNSRILDAESSVKTVTKAVKPNCDMPVIEGWLPDYYVKCWKCKAKVALKKIDTTG